MTLKSLVTGLVTGTAAAAVVGGAAAGVTFIASPVLPSAPAVKPVVFGVPMPQAPGVPATAGDIYATLNGLQGGGSFAAGKDDWIEDGLGRMEGRTADRLYRNAAAQGYFPLDFVLGPINSDGNTANVNVTASGPKLAPVTQNLTFMNAGDHWVLSKASAMALLSAVG